MAADITKSIVHLNEDLYLNGGVKDFIHARSVTTSDPADFTAVAGASGIANATVTVSGVAVGDIVLGYGVVSGLAANSYVIGAYVSATDTVTFVIGGKINTAVTTTALVANLIIADIT